MSERGMPQLKYAEKEDKTSINSLKMLVAKQAEVLAAIRDLLQETEKIRKIIDEYVNLQAQVMERGITYSLDRIRWIKTEGPSGPYEYADASDNRDNEDFKLLVADLKEHEDCRMTRDGYFIWLFSEANRVGRKPSRKRRKS